MANPQAKPAPVLKVPESDSTVSVRVIDSTAFISCPSSAFVEPPIRGYDDLACPAYAFLITNTLSNGTQRHVLFDLGVRSDLENYPPATLQFFKKLGLTLEVPKGIAQILDEAPTVDKSTPSSKSIEAIVWSHHHFDHTGDPSTFPFTTTLVVGPGFKQHMLPGYPANQESLLPSTDWEGRELREIAFESDLRIGGFKTFDYFGDGSFYLLDTPGHAIGHICGLARVTTSPDTFVFMGGDAAHHGAELRPTEYLPLPDAVNVPQSVCYRSSPCPGDVLMEAVQRSRESVGSRQCGSRTAPWFVPTEGCSFDKPGAVETIKKIFDFDANENVFCIMAHDTGLKPVLKLFPEDVNGWAKAAMDERSRWNFVQDFTAVLEDETPAS